MTAVTTVAAGTWLLRTATAEFCARDLLRKPVRGTLPVRSGEMRVGADGRVTGATAELDLAGVSTGHPKRDRDLRGRRFFDVEVDPLLRFTGGPAQHEDGRWVLPGTLRLKGIECPVELAVELIAASADVVSVRATTTLDRRDAGIRVPRLLVGPRVEVTVTAELVPARSER